MTTQKKYVMPEIDREAVGPGVAEFITYVEDLTRDANAVYEEVLALEAEIARLKKAKKRGSRAPK